MNTPPWRALALTALAISGISYWLLSNSSFTQPAGDTASPAQNTASQSPTPSAKEDSLVQALLESRLEIEPVMGRSAEGNRVRFHATNPQGLSAQFTDVGTRLTSTLPEKTWQAQVRVTGLGRGDTVSTLPKEAPPLAQGKRVEYARGTLTEWYENKPEGLEHGMTLHERPEGNPTAKADERVRVDLTVEGLSVQPKDDGLVLADQTQNVMSYHGLKVWDAQGRNLQASLAPSSHGMSIWVADAGAQYPITIDPLFTSLEARLSRSELECGKPQDFFGHSVAIQGDLALVGCPGDDNLLGVDAGGAYVFQRTGSTWALLAKLKANDGKAGDRFGGSVAFGTGFLLVGSRLADLPGKVDAGAVYMFVPSANGWVQSAKLVARDSAAGAWFGESLSIDGTLAIIGAPNADGLRGSAYVFQRSRNTCVQRALLKASDAQVGDGFGESVAISGTQAAVGAPKRAANTGAVYFYGQVGANWLQAQTIIAPSAQAGDFFGEAVVMDDTRALVGAPGRFSGVGVVFAYFRPSTSWSFDGELFAQDDNAGDLFGTSLSLFRRTVLIGAPGDDLTQPNQGSAYLFTSEEGFPWSQQAKLINVEGRDSDNFGTHVALEGTTAIVSAYQADAPGWNSQIVTDLGAVHVFRVFSTNEAGIEIRANESPSNETQLDEVDEDSTLEFGDVLVGQSTNSLLLIQAAQAKPGRKANSSNSTPVSSFLIENLGGRTLTGLRGVITGTHANQFKLAEPIPNSLPPGGSFSISVIFKPTSVGVKTATLRITSSDRNRPALQFPLSGTGVVIDPGTDPAEIVEDPLSQMVSLGQNVRFNSQAIGSPTLRYQWRRGSSNLAGKTANVLGLRAALSSAGLYSVRASNRFGNDVSESATLWVVDTRLTRLEILQGQRATLKAVAAGPGLSYSWFYSTDGGVGTPLTTGSKYTISPDGKTLTVNNLVLGDTGVYYCIISAEGYELIGGRYELDVITSAPIFASEFNLPSGRITTPYSFQVPFNTVGNATPDSFSASGLPPGLVIDRNTGRIHGVPTGDGNRGYSVTITARNARGSSTVQSFLYIEGLDCDYFGTFTGLVERDGGLNGDFGGQVVLNILPTASYSGTLTLGSQRLPFAGRFRYSGVEAGISVAVSIPRPRPQGPVRFAFVIHPESDGLVGTLTDATTNLNVQFERLAGTLNTPGTLDGPAEAARFNQPHGLARDRAGNVYVADTANHVIRRIAPNGQVLTFAGVAGQSGLENGCGEEVRFNRPTGIAIDSRGWLYVADSGNRVIRLVTSEGKTTTLAGSGALGTADGTGNAASFTEPYGITFAVDGSSVFVTDRGAHNIRRVTLAGVVTTLAGKAATPGTRNGSGVAALFNQPSGLVAYLSPTEGEILAVVDRRNHCIRKVVVRSRAVSTLAGALSILGKNNGMAANARFFLPIGISVDNRGNFFVTDSGNSVIRRISNIGVVTTVTRACDLTFDHQFDGGFILNSAEIPSRRICCGFEEESPFGILNGILWSSGKLIVSDSEQHLIVHSKPASACVVDVLALRNPWGNDPARRRDLSQKDDEESFRCNNPPAERYAGNYHFATSPCMFFIKRDAATTPEGSSLGSITVRPNGTTTWAMVLADGTSITGSSTLGGMSYEDDYLNQMPLFSMLYTGTGSVQGWIDFVNGRIILSPLGEKQDLLFNETFLNGCLGWMKIPQVTPSRNYGKGIIMHGMSVVGERLYSDNAGLVEEYFRGSSNNARISFDGGGLLDSLTQAFTLNSNFTAQISGTDLTFTMNPATLRFNGTYKFLTTTMDQTQSQPTQVERTVPYRGLFLRRMGQGMGFFLLDQLPNSEFPNPSTTPIFSGQVILRGSQDDG